ncbi:MAG: 2-oxoacid:acceptor oxidoreductase family protein [Oscillospiraceae bacterium]|nr:2-oxoacid:acceptor oxidoreductase family protein [Oscillospiraceae bacterium]
MTHEILLAGFGGQGVLFAGMLLCNFALTEQKNVSWLPSYGPAMRGGTCNCSVCIDDNPIGSPMVLKPDVLFVMNQPSYDKFISSVKPGGVAFVNSTLVEKSSKCRDDITIHYIEGSKLAAENNLAGMANTIMVGKFLKETNIVNPENSRNAILMSVGEAKTHLIEPNMKAIDIGRNN